MSSFTGQRGTRFTFDINLRGKVQIAVENPLYGGSQDVPPFLLVDVPGSDLIDFVADSYVRPRLIREIQEATTDDLLRVFTR